MRSFGWGLKKWESWAKIGLSIFPYIKKECTSDEVDGIIKIIGSTNRFIRVLDVCCGWGRHCQELADRGYQNIFGIDVSKTFINYARVRDPIGRVRFINEDVMEIGLFADQFDVALSLWHSIGLYRSIAQNVEFFKIINMLLKPSGKLLIDSANSDWDLQRIRSFRRTDYIPGNRHWWHLADSNLLGLVEASFDAVEKTVDYRILACKLSTEIKFMQMVAQNLEDRTITRLAAIHGDDHIPGNKHWNHIGHKELELFEIKNGSNNKMNGSHQVYRGLVRLNDNPMSSQRVPLRLFKKSELIEILGSAGFKVTRIYGDFELNKYSITSPRLIIVAIKQNNE